MKQNQLKKDSLFKKLFNIRFFILCFIVASAFYYLYSINCNAVKGYQIRELEKDIATLKKEYKSMKIVEAEIRSLYYIEEESKKLNMAEANVVKYIDEMKPVALK